MTDITPARARGAGEDDENLRTGRVSAGIKSCHPPNTNKKNVTA